MIPGITDGIRMLQAITMTLWGESALKTSRPFRGQAGFPAGILPAAFSGTNSFNAVQSMRLPPGKFALPLLEFRAPSSRNLGAAIVLHYRRSIPQGNPE